MQIKEFQIQKFRNIQDSTPVLLADNLTCIVGKNQSGKTSILKALHRFNPHNKTLKYDISRDWPRGERRAKDPKQVVARIVFALDDVERKVLGEMWQPAAQNLSLVQVTKNYAGEFEVTFPEDKSLFPDSLHPTEVEAICTKIQPPNDPVGPQFKAEAGNRLTEMQRLALEGKFTELAKSLDSFRSVLASARTEGNPQPQHENEEEFINRFASAFPGIVGEIKKLPTVQAKVHEYIVGGLPVFIYMDDYRAFTGTVDLQDILGRLKAGKNSAQDQNVLMILKLAGLNLEQLVAQGASGNQETIRDRQYDIEDAAKTLTNDVAGRWGQNPYKVQFRADGQKFFTEIEEVNKDVGMIPLEEQSKGFQWFFSFDLWFMHDSAGSFEGCVLLLDEPGLHLHPGAQDDLLKRLDAYAAKNALIYTTHLPFLVDIRDPARIHVIQERNKATVVSDDLSLSGIDEKLTLQAALGMKAHQHYLVSEKNVVVEGAHDFILLTELSNLLARSGKAGLDVDISISAAGGAQEAVYLSTFMVGQGLGVVALFDSDSEGRLAEEKLRTKWITRYKESKSSTILLGSVFGESADFSIEDLFDETFYLQASLEAHAKQVKVAGTPSVTPQGVGMLVDRIGRGFESHGITFNKGSVAKIIRAKLRAMPDASALDGKTVTRSEALVAKLNSQFA